MKTYGVFLLIGCFFIISGFSILQAEQQGGGVYTVDSYADWRVAGGYWEYQQGKCYLKTTEKECICFGPKADWGDYIYELKARKRNGAEGFLIPFRVQDANRYYLWNIGGWRNTRHVIQYYGEKNDDFAHKPGKIETGKWCDIKIIVKGSHFECYLDGKLVNQADDDRYPTGGIGLGGWLTEIDYKDLRVTSLDGKELLTGPAFSSPAAHVSEAFPTEIYRKKKTCVETLVASRRSLRKHVTETGKRVSDEAVVNLWRKLEKDFPAEVDIMRADLEESEFLEWFRGGSGNKMAKTMIRRRLDRMPGIYEKFENKFKELLADGSDNVKLLDFYQQLPHAFIDNIVQNCPPIIFLKWQRHGRNGTNATMLGRRTNPGSSICIYDPSKPNEGTRTIFKTENGFVFDMSLSYDAEKLLFSYMEDVVNHKGSFHIWQMNIDGTNLKQLTDGPYHDASAVYLPDGRIVFCSTRVKSFSLCQDFLAAAMYIIDSDGSNLRRIEYNTLCDTTPFVLDNGSILFTRWEYQDKNIFSVEGLWTINPDGSRVQLFYGNTITIPNAIYGARQIPGTSRILCVMAAHHHRPIGAIAVIDRSLGLENPRAITNITPEVPYHPTVGKNWRDCNWGPGDKSYPYSYADPYPISDKLFVAAYGGMNDGPKRHRIYLMDYQGNKRLLCSDPELFCFSPIPIQKRPLPHIIPGQVSPEPKGQGTFFVSDIYEGLIDKGVKQGQVKQLLIMSQTPKKYNTEGPRYHDHYPVMGHGSYYAKNCLGTVPVDKNGSVYFTAPAGIELYFIALDKDGKEIRRMGSITQITDGENQSCIGCHESRFKAPALDTGAMARLSKKPDAITPMPWGAGTVSYVKQVQPVLDKYCVKCHSGRTPKARMDLSGDKTRFYNMSYRSLIDRKLVEYYYINPGPTGNFPPLASGSWVSKLTKVIESNHSNTNMDDQSRRRIYNWIDANAPYYDRWDMTRPYTMGGRDLWHYVENNRRTTPKRQPWFAKLEDIYMNNCSSCHGRISNPKKSDWGNRSDSNAWINLTNPQYSRVLNAHLAKKAGGMGLVKQKDGKSPPVFADTTDKTYQAMLNAIKSGKKALYDRPRVDMDRAVPIAQQRNFGKLY